VSPLSGESFHLSSIDGFDSTAAYVFLTELKKQHTDKTAAAPLVAYVAAVGGLKSIVLTVMLFLFPIHERNKITKWQWVAIVMVVLGVFVIEFWR
jgi:drug/metabolite transporter (DMT)-like permease